MGSFLTSRRTFFIIALGFTAGIFIRSLAAFPALLVSVLALALLLASLHARSPRVLLWSLFLFSASLGIFRFDVSSRGTMDETLDANIGEMRLFEAVIADEPDRRESATLLTLELQALMGGGDKIPVDGRSLIRVSPYETWDYGDRVLVAGTLAYPEAFATESGRMFDYPAYLEGKGIRYQIERPALTLVGKDGGNFVMRALFGVKRRFLDNLGRLVHEPERSLLAGLLVGDKQSLGKEWIDKFRDVGVVHLVVLSGYNIAIVAETVIALSSLAFPAVAPLLASFAIILFALMVGASATVVRASLMALLVIFARRIGRQYDITTALALAGFLMLLHNPHILVFDPSFQLSFLATLGLIYGAPAIEPYFKFLPARFGLRDIATATIATQIFVLPLLLFMTGSLSVVSLPANLAILLVVPAAMLFGFLAGALSFVSFAIATPFALVVSLILSYQLAVVDLFSRVPYAAVAVGALPGAAMFSLYGAIAVLFLRRRARPHS